MCRLFDCFCTRVAAAVDRPAELVCTFCPFFDGSDNHQSEKCLQGLQTDRVGAGIGEETSHVSQMLRRVNAGDHYEPKVTLEGIKVMSNYSSLQKTEKMLWNFHV